MTETQSVQAKPTFTTIQFVTKDGEKCTATKNNGIVTVSGDKNGVRQLPVDQFMKELIETLPKNVNLERTPNKDKVQFSGNEEPAKTEPDAADKAIDETNKKLNKKYFGIAAAALAVVGTGIYLLGRGKWWSKAAKEVENKGKNIVDGATGKKRQSAHSNKTTPQTNQDIVETIDNTLIGTIIAEDLAKTGQTIDRTEGALGGTEGDVIQQFTDFAKQITGKANPSGEEFSNAMHELLGKIPEDSITEGVSDSLGSLLNHFSELLG